ncbi:protein FAM32A-like [Impatiens glandulifera]|uniref:protein FAM32A-like n=1 Tax=Impatiens glandulifera TaxID=253017 RepID=UPI001FB0F3CA|nr:protein FAM32A-like [Impatiens glandulifera]
MSSYDNVVGGKLKLKGKALDVKAGGMKKKKKHNKKNYDQITSVTGTELNSDGTTGMSGNADDEDDLGDSNNRVTGDGNATGYQVHLTPAEKRYMEQKEQIDVHKLAKTANKSHRDRIQDFNQYLANMSEHYDIPKVGPG